jgi:hypothetical protein
MYPLLERPLGASLSDRDVCLVICGWAGMQPGCEFDVGMSEATPPLPQNPLLGPRLFNLVCLPLRSIGARTVVLVLWIALRGCLRSAFSTTARARVRRW